MNAAAAAALGHTLHNNDGAFWMSFADFATYFGDVGFGQWSDTDVAHHKNAVWDRSLSQLSLQYTIHNPVQQDVYVSTITDERRQFMSNTCADPSRFYA